MRLEPVPFPPAGEGVALRLTFPDLVAVEKEVLAGRVGMTDGERRQFGGQALFNRIVGFDVISITAVLRHGLRNADGTRWEGDVAELDVPLSEVVPPILDAVSLSFFGKLGGRDAEDEPDAA